MTVEKLFIKEKINQTESLRQVLENGAFNDSALIDFVYDDWGRLPKAFVAVPRSPRWKSCLLAR